MLAKAMVRYDSEGKEYEIIKQVIFTRKDAKKNIIFYAQRSQPVFKIFKNLNNFII